MVRHGAASPVSAARLRGDGRDERFDALDRRATAHAGLAVILAVIVGFIIEIANGRSGAPFTCSAPSQA